MSNKVNLEYSALRKNRKATRKAVLLWRKLEDNRLREHHHFYGVPRLMWGNTTVYSGPSAFDSIYMAKVFAKSLFAASPRPIFLSIDHAPDAVRDTSFSWPLTVTVAPRSGLAFDIEPGQEDSSLAFIDHIHDKINKAIGVPYRWPNVDFDRPIIRPSMGPFFDEKLIVNDCHLDHDTRPVSDFFKAWMDAVKATDVSPKLIHAIGQQEGMKSKLTHDGDIHCEPDMSIYIFELGDIRIAGRPLQRTTNMRKKKHAHRSVLVRRIVRARKMEKVYPLGPPTMEQSDGKINYNFSFNKFAPLGNT